jgi:hypothetical protein
MKKVIYIIALLIGVTTMAQTITVNGTPMLVSDDISFPFWLESGSSISPEVPVSSISVLEFNIVPNNNGNDMVFNQVISVTEGQTVPEGKTWKVESILMENQEFVVDSSNTSLDSAFVASMIAEALSSNQGSTGISNATVDSIGQEVSNLDSLMQIITPFFGCTDPTACNYDSIAVIDNGLCSGLLGCMDSQSENYNASATCDDGSCIPYVGMYAFGGVVYRISGNTAYVFNINYEETISFGSITSVNNTANELNDNGFDDWEGIGVSNFEEICSNVGLFNTVVNYNGGVLLSTDSYYWTNTNWCSSYNGNTTTYRPQPYSLNSCISMYGGCPDYGPYKLRVHRYFDF